MAIETFLQGSGLYKSSLPPVSMLEQTVDFGENQAAAGQIIPLFTLPPNTVLKAFGAYVLNPEDPTKADAVMGVYTKTGTAYTAVTNGNTASVDVDNPALDKFAAIAGIGGTTPSWLYLVPGNATHYVGVATGASTGALIKSRIRFWAYVAYPPLLPEAQRISL